MTMSPRSSPLVSVRIDLGARSYDVLVGPGARTELARMVPVTARQAVVVTQAGIGVAAGLEAGVPTTIVEIPPGEGAKSLATVEMLSRSFAETGLTRRDVVIGVGGGVVTDVAGFAASCWHRGTGVIHVATTLLAQIDAAIGGKTGVNLPEGKNLVGAFWQPLGVICDIEVLASLPPAEWRSGRGELAKYAFLGVEDLDTLDLGEQVARCIECKGRIVSADETEDGLRMVLNYGHTLAHALEAAGLAGESGDFEDATAHEHSAGAPLLRHGEAVAVGLVFAARLAKALGRIDEERVERHERLVADYELPSRLPSGAEPACLIELMRRDKKAQGDLTFVLDGPRGVEPVRGVPSGTVLEVLEGLR
ncbi:MAG TPA: 3-dehydroquinate synthase family protein [Acidimicrobiales bacterium]|nr:3-dehydroquinate synthase family protein [Acidimicrobiales bacterium]